MLFDIKKLSDVKLHFSLKIPGFFSGVISEVYLLINLIFPWLQGTDYTKSTQIALWEIRYRYMGKGAKDKRILKVV